MRQMKSIGVFCGSGVGRRAAYAAAARELGIELGRRGLRVVYGGGNAGLMGIVADAAIGSGAEVIGVIPRFLVDKEVAHHGLSQLHVVETMHERKALMAQLSDHFIALPGGYGTLDELCEMLSWRQLGLHRGRVGLLEVEGYFNALVRFMDHASDEGFVRAGGREQLRVSSSVGDLLEQLASA
jgi:uncharacterized protein (TIGR00730 family)